MKKLLLKHGKLIITGLIKKYDKMVIVFGGAGQDEGIIKANNTKEPKMSPGGNE